MKPTYTVSVPRFISLDIKAFRNAGAPKTTVEHICHNHWRIQEQYKDLFTKYYILFWSPEYLLNEIHNGQIVHDSVVYNVIYHDRKNPLYYRKHCNQVALSFRAAIPEYGIHPVVLVKGHNIS